MGLAGLVGHMRPCIFYFPMKASISSGNVSSIGVIISKVGSVCIVTTGSATLFHRSVLSICQVIWDGVSVVSLSSLKSQTNHFSFVGLGCVSLGDMAGGIGPGGNIRRWRPTQSSGP
eukprot:scaffold26242_cov50-Attheya_sp.AAC.5